MPTTRHRRAQGRVAVLHEGWQTFFATGDEYGGPTKWDVVLERARHAAMWAEHREAFLAEWISTHARSRPFCWWKYSALAPRRVVRGAELLMPVRAPDDWEWVWRENFGIQAFVQCRPSGYVGLPLVEAQGEYLDRLGLLTQAERAALTPKDFAPEEIDPFQVSEDELRARGIV